MLPLRFNCWVCQSKGQPCVSETFLKQNWENCEAARKGLGFGVYKTKEECDNVCVGDKPIDLTPVCWGCEGEAEDWKCNPYFGIPGTKCPTDPPFYATKASCESGCPFQPIGPPLQPIEPPLQPIEPPLEPVTPVRNKMMWYIIITVIVLVLIALILGTLILFA